MPFEYGKPYLPLFHFKGRYIHFLGGRGRGGSYTATKRALQLITGRDYFRGYFMREVFNDIRDSLWADFKDRIDESELDEADFHFNDSSMVVTYLPTGNRILAKGFKKSSTKRTAKLKSLAGATHVFIEETEEIEETDFRQLDDSLRTKKSQPQIYMVFNMPSKNHWIIKKWYNLLDSEHPGYFIAVPKADNNLLSIHSTYQDNIVNLDSTFINNLINYSTTDPDYYYTMVKGLVTEGVKGRIYRNWKLIQKMPNLYPKFYGLDWGFSGDPLAFTELEIHNRDLWIERKIYQHGLTNDDLHNLLIQMNINKRSPIYADSAQPKDIEDMKRKGWNFIAAVKGSGSVKTGINFIKQYNVHMTEDSTEYWTEFENYAWALDQFKNPTGDPIDKWNHGMDSINYAMDHVRVNRTGPSFVNSFSGKKASNGRTIDNM